MRFAIRACALAAAAVMAACGTAQAQHLWWNLQGHKDATCLYGRVTVLATHPTTYYSIANWHPGAPGSGYCGIQHNSLQERRTIFSVWDTSDKLHPKVTFADPKTVHNRFGGEGTGAHSHMTWPWRIGEPVHFFVRKQPVARQDSVDTAYYIYDAAAKQWLHVATITSPRGGKPSVSDFGGAVASFLENFSGRDRNVPKLATYRVWLGKSPTDLKPLVHAAGDGTWGQLHDAYFLAEGDSAGLGRVFRQFEKDYGKPAFGGGKTRLKPLSAEAPPAELIDKLKLQLR